MEIGLPGTDITPFPKLYSWSVLTILSVSQGTNNPNIKKKKNSKLYNSHIFHSTFKASQKNSDFFLIQYFSITDFLFVSSDAQLPLLLMISDQSTLHTVNQSCFLLGHFVSSCLLLSGEVWEISHMTGEYRGKRIMAPSVETSQLDWIWFFDRSGVAGAVLQTHL